MGYNTVAFLLNDRMHELDKSPHATTYGLTHPPHSDSERDIELWRWGVDRTADQHKEPRIPWQALEVLRTFHADETQYLRAGGNCIAKLEVVRYSKDRKSGKNTVTLELPGWWDKKRHR